MKPDYEKVPVEKFRRRVAQRAGVSVALLKRVLDAFWEEIHQIVISKRRMFIPGIGEFYATRYEGGNVFTDCEGELSYARPYYRLTFASSVLWRKRVKEAMKYIDDE